MPSRYNYSPKAYPTKPLLNIRAFSSSFYEVAFLIDRNVHDFTEIII